VKKNAKGFLVLAALPFAILAILAAAGARAEVGVVMTGSGANVLLGAAWVACWLASIVVSPIALGAAAVSMVIGSTGWPRSYMPSTRTLGKWARSRSRSPTSDV